MIKTRETFLTAVAVTIAAIAGYVITKGSPSTLRLTIWSVGFLWVVVPVVWGRTRRRFDFIEPIWPVAIAMLLMFFFRPLSLIAGGQFVHRGYDISSTMAEAAALALVGSLCLLLGYISAFSGKIGKALRPLPERWHPDTVVVAALALIAAAGFLYGLFLMQSGGVSTLLWFASGRETGQATLLRSSSGYFYQGPFLLVPAGLLLFASGFVQNRRYLKVFGLGTLLPLFFLYFGSGGRLNLMVAVSAFVVFWLLWTRKRPSILGLVVLGYLTLTIGIGFMGEARVVEHRDRSRLKILWEMLLGPQRALDRLTTGGDLDMYDAFANLLTVVPEKLPFQHGSIIIDPFVRMIPRQLWTEGKPMEANDMFVALQWPQQFKVSRAGPASSFLGQLYQDSGWLTLILGMLVLGIGLRALWEWRTQWPANPAVQLMFAAVLPYVIVLLRGNLTHVLSTGMFTLVPLFVVLSVAGYPTRRPETTHLKTNGSRNLIASTDMGPLHRGGGD